LVRWFVGSVSTSKLPKSYVDDMVKLIIILQQITKDVRSVEADGNTFTLIMKVFHGLAMRK